MIRSFADRETERIFKREWSPKLPPDIQRPALRKLWMLSAATNIFDLRIPPANHLEKLRGSRLGQYSIRINQQWRICFRWISHEAYDVEITDYH